MEKPMILNPLNENQRKFLQVCIAVLLILLLSTLYIIFRNYQTSTSPEVVLEDSRLQVFDDIYEQFDYPSRIFIHDPYLLVIQPLQAETKVYNLKTKRKEETVRQILLDYDGNNLLYNEAMTFFNTTNLGVLCTSGFIQSENNVLCVVNNSRNNVLSINPGTNVQHVIYQTPNLITTLSYIQGNMYVGEMDMKTNRSYLIKNGKRIEVSTPVNIAYPMNGKVYLGSFQSVFTGNKNVVYELNGFQVSQENKKQISIQN